MNRIIERMKRTAENETIKTADDVIALIKSREVDFGAVVADYQSDSDTESFKGYKSNDYYEPDEPAYSTVSAWFKCSITKESLEGCLGTTLTPDLWTEVGESLSDMGYDLFEIFGTDLKNEFAEIVGSGTDNEETEATIKFEGGKVTIHATLEADTNADYDDYYED